MSHFHPAAYLDEATLWLPSMLRKSGYTTGAVDHLFAMKDWFIRGYDDYMPPPGRSRSPGSVINGIGLPWISEHAHEDFFLFLHFWDAHIPYVPPSPFKERFSYRTAGRIDPDITEKLEGRPSYPLFKQNLYDFLDPCPTWTTSPTSMTPKSPTSTSRSGGSSTTWPSEGLLDDTLVVLFGDHGENMTEHDSWFDHAGLYDSVVHVPLILWAPGHIPAADVSAMVTLVDVLPTVLEVIGLDPAVGVDGRSLMPLVRGETTAHRDVVMLSEATWQACRGVRTDEWKLVKYLQSTIYGRDGVELYDLAEDPSEQFNVADQHPEVVEDMSARLQHWVSAQLAGRPDPMLSVIDAGLPAVARLNDVVDGLARPRNDVPTPPAPGHDLVPVGAGMVLEADAVDADAAEADRAQRFAPRNAHRRRLRGARGVVVAAMVVGAALLLGFAVDDILLANPVAATGVVQPASDAQLNMSTTGPIAAIPVHVGQTVRAGEVLASQDTSALTAKLAADQSKLSADQATLQQQQSGVQSEQLQQLKDQVTVAQVQLTTAQQKLSQTTATTNATVAAAQAQLQSDQTMMAADQQTYQDDAAACVSATPPPNCAADQRQVQVDQGKLGTDQNSYRQVQADQQSEVERGPGVGKPGQRRRRVGTSSTGRRDRPGVAGDHRRHPGSDPAGHRRHRHRQGPSGPSRAHGTVRRHRLRHQRHRGRGRHQPRCAPSHLAVVGVPLDVDRHPDLPAGADHPVHERADLCRAGLTRFHADQAGRPGARDGHSGHPYQAEGPGLAAGHPGLESHRHRDPDRTHPGQPGGTDLFPGGPGDTLEGAQRSQPRFARDRDVDRDHADRRAHR